MSTPRTLTALLALTAITQAGPAFATPEGVCALLWPFFQSPPSHFVAQRGVAVNDKAWNSKSNPQADALNAVCQIQSYLVGRNELDCRVRFDASKIQEQNDFYQEAVLGLDFCMSKLSYGDSWSRTVTQTVNKNLESTATTWYKSTEKQQFGAEVDETLYKSSKSREVKIDVFFQQR